MIMCELGQIYIASISFKCDSILANQPAKQPTSQSVSQIELTDKQTDGRTDRRKVQMVHAVALELLTKHKIYIYQE